MTKAIIYVRGTTSEMQEVFCRLYAAEKRYNIAFTTTDLEDVRNCDVLLIANAARISRKPIEYYTAVKKFAKMGIKVETATSHENALDLLDIAHRMPE